MKAKIYISITLLFFSSFSIAQKFKTSVVLSPGISRYSSNNSVIEKNKIEFAFSGGLKEEFIFSKTFSLGVELQYLKTNGNFQNHLDLTAIPEIHNSFRHIFSIQSFDALIFLKIRTDSIITKGLYFYLGGGLSYIIQADRKIDIVTTYDYSPDKKDISPVTSGSTTLKNENNNAIGTIALLGIGKYFVIKNKMLFCEIKYRFDFNKWIYTTVNDPVNDSFDIKRQCLLINIGMTFK